MPDAEESLDRLEQVLGLKWLGEHEMRSGFLGRREVGIGRRRWVDLPISEPHDSYFRAVRT